MIESRARRSVPLVVAAAVTLTGVAGSLAGCSSVTVADGGAFAPGRQDEWDYFIQTTAGPVKVSTRDYNACVARYASEPGDTEDVAAGWHCSLVANRLRDADRPLALRFARKGCEEYKSADACRSYVSILYYAGKGRPGEIEQARNLATELCRRGGVFKRPTRYESGIEERYEFCESATFLYPPGDYRAVAMAREACEHGIAYSCEWLRGTGRGFDETAAMRAKEERVRAQAEATAARRELQAEERRTQTEEKRGREELLNTITGSVGAASTTVSSASSYPMPAPGAGRQAGGQGLGNATPSQPGRPGTAQGAASASAYGQSGPVTSTGAGGSSSGSNTIAGAPKYARPVDCVAASTTFLAPPYQNNMNIKFVNHCTTAVRIVWCTEGRDGSWGAEETEIRVAGTLTSPEFNATGRYRFWACEKAPYDYSCGGRCPGR